MDFSEQIIRIAKNFFGVIFIKNNQKTNIDYLPKLLETILKENNIGCNIFNFDKKSNTSEEFLEFIKLNRAYSNNIFILNNIEELQNPIFFLKSLSEFRNKIVFFVILNYVTLNKKFAFGLNINFNDKEKKFYQVAQNEEFLYEKLLSFIKSANNEEIEKELLETQPYQLEKIILKAIDNYLLSWVKNTNFNKENNKLKNNDDEKIEIIRKLNKFRNTFFELKKYKTSNEKIIILFKEILGELR